MKSQTNTLVVAVLGSLVVGLLLGFIPEYVHSSSQQERITALEKDKSDAQTQLNRAQNSLTLSRFAVRAGVVSAQANMSNYSVASGASSSLFTDLRKYIDSASRGEAKPQIEQVLGARDRTISGLAQANPDVKPLLQQEFLQLESVATPSQ